MKFLADMGIAMSTVRALREKGYDTVHLRDQNLHKLSDEKILKKAQEEERIILTFDLDFGALLYAGLHQSPSVIIFRMNIQTPATVTKKLFGLLGEHSRELENGAVVVVESFRYRIRDLPITDVEEADE